MIELPVYDKGGQEVDRMQIDEALLGRWVRPALLKQAVVMYHANRRQGTATTRSRGMVAGSTRKLYRQKGTGRARAGAIRSNIRKGGGVAFAKPVRDFRQDMPRKQRRLARDSAVLAKIRDNDAVVIDKLDFAAPKTKEFAAILSSLKIDRSCLVAISENDANVYKSLRNLPKVNCLSVSQLNAGEVCGHRKLLFTRAALEALLAAASRATANASV